MSRNAWTIAVGKRQIKKMNNNEEIVCFECLDGNHPECNGYFQRCDCWECLEQEMNPDLFQDELDDVEDEE